MLARVVALLAPALLCAGLALADGGQGIAGGQNGQGQGQALGNQQAPVSQPSPQAAPVASAARGIVAIHEMTGTLDDIVGGFALGHPYFVFTSGGTTYEIKAAPFKLLTNLNVSSLIGETILMKFAECRQGSYLALQITYNATVYVFRDETGKPVWRQWQVDTSAGAVAGQTIDAASVETLTAVVENIGVSAVSNMVRVRLRLANQERAWVTLGPDSLLLDQGFELQVGDQLRIMLAVQATNRERVALQVENPETGAMALIRNREGHQYRLMYD